MMKTAITLAASLCLLASCSTEPPPLPDNNSSERPLISAQQCNTQDGEVVGDIGDGRVHRDDFLCPSGKPPIGTIQAEQGKRSIEGAVCCLL